MERAVKLPKGVFGRTFLVIASIAFSILLAEAIVRWIDPPLPYQFMPQRIEASFYAPSTVTEFTLVENYEGRFMMSEAAFDSFVRTNSRGWRDDEPDGRPKILVLGDSYVFGWGQNNGETIPDRLEDLGGEQTDFVNLGYVAGRSPDSYLSYLRHSTDLQGRPTIVVIYSNDLYDVAHNEYFDHVGNPVEVDDPDLAEVRGRMALIRGGHLFEHETFVTGSLPVGLIRALKQSHLIGLVRDRWSRATPRELTAETEAKAVATKESAGPVPSPDWRLDRVLRSLEGLSSVASRLAVVTLGPKGETQPSAFYRAVEAWAIQAGIPYVAVPAFGPDGYWLRDRHHNAEGARRTAERISRELGDWLSEKPSTPDSLTTAPGRPHESH